MNVIMEQNPEPACVAHKTIENSKALDLLDYSVPSETISAAQASEFISLIEEKISGFLSLGKVDTQTFANSIVLKARKSLFVLARTDALDRQENPEFGEESGVCLSEKIGRQLRSLLLKRPRKLFASLPVTISSRCATAEERIKELELQILLRMEMISSDHIEVLEKVKDKLVKDICKILDNVQFHLEGGIFGGGIQHFCSHVFSRYKETHPSTIDFIRSYMEFNGYRVIPAPKNVHPSLPRTGKELDANGAVGIPMKPENGFGKGIDKISSGSQNRASGHSRTSKGSVKKSFKLGGERLWVTGLQVLSSPKTGSYHFATEASKLIRVKRVRPYEKPKAKNSIPCRLPAESRIPTNYSTVNIVCQTPNPVGRLFGPQVNCETNRVGQYEQRVRGGQVSSGVELSSSLRTKKRLIPADVILTGPVSTSTLDDRLAKVSRICGAVPDSPQTCSSNINQIVGSSLGEPRQRPAITSSFTVKTTNAVLRKDGDCQFTCDELLQICEHESRKDQGRKSGSDFHRDSHGMDDDDDVAEEGIPSTPFKPNVANQSALELSPKNLELPGCLKLQFPPWVLPTANGTEFKHQGLWQNSNTVVRGSPSNNAVDKSAYDPCEDKESLSVVRYGLCNCHEANGHDEENELVVHRERSFKPCAGAHHPSCLYSTEEQADLSGIGFLSRRNTQSKTCEVAKQRPTMGPSSNTRSRRRNLQI